MANGHIRPPIRGRRFARTTSGRRRFPCARCSFTRPKVDKAAVRAGDSTRRGVDGESAVDEQRRSQLPAAGAGVGGQGQRRDAESHARVARQAAGRWRLVRSGFDGEQRLRDRKIALLRCRPRGCRASDAAYQRAVKFLLNTQQEDGSWYVQDARDGVPAVLRRRLPPRLRSVDFRRGTSWATMALAQASQTRTVKAAGER